MLGLTYPRTCTAIKVLTPPDDQVLSCGDCGHSKCSDMKMPPARPGDFVLFKVILLGSDREWPR